MAGVFRTHFRAGPLNGATLLAVQRRLAAEPALLIEFVNLLIDFVKIAVCDRSPLGSLLLAVSQAGREE